MHKIEELAKRLHGLASELSVASSKYVELATQLKEGVAEHDDIDCTLVNANDHVFMFRISAGDLSETGKQKMYAAMEAGAVGYSTDIGVLWGTVNHLAASVTNELQGNQQQEEATTEPEAQVFKVEDDN